jgi:two-component system response regulator YesN
MYKILIVDDEQIIRHGIISSIDWGNYGYVIAGEAENGKAALDKAMEIKPDVILTDIYMPLMDGIDFSREIKKHLPEVIIIFLTGYNAFTYAQQAIEIGVFRYITKPVLHEELIQTLLEASDALEHKEMEKAHIDKLKRLLKDSLPLFKERFFLNLVMGVFTEEEIENKLYYLDLDLASDYYTCIIITLDDFTELAQKNSEADMNLIKFSIQTISEEVLSDQNHIICTFEEKRNEIGILCGVRDIGQDDAMLDLHQRIKQLQNSARQYLKATVSAGIGKFYPKLIDMDKSYNEAMMALEYRMAFGRNSIIFIEDMNQSSEIILSHSMIQKINDLILNTKGGNKEQAHAALCEIFKGLKGAGVPKRDYVHLLGIEIVNRIVRIILEFGANLSDVLGSSFSPFHIMKIDTLEDVQKELALLIDHSVSFIRGKHHVVTRNSIEKAKEYILENYSNSEINLTTIAESVHVSPGYFSQLFKQVTGETCIEYLTKIRIDSAKKLLKETALKTYEIADQIGFKDSQYFSTCFKKLIGVSPTDYRDIIQNDFLV